MKNLINAVLDALKQSVTDFTVTAEQEIQAYYKAMVYIDCVDSETMEIWNEEINNLNDEDIKTIQDYLDYTALRD